MLSHNFLSLVKRSKRIDTIPGKTTFIHDSESTQLPFLYQFVDSFFTTLQLISDVSNIQNLWTGCIIVSSPVRAHK
jgi:hypothetical protein